jgi:hypothetical protein
MARQLPRSKIRHTLCPDWRKIGSAESQCPRIFRLHLPSFFWIFWIFKIYQLNLDWQKNSNTKVEKVFFMSVVPKKEKN